MFIKNNMINLPKLLTISQIKKDLKERKYSTLDLVNNCIDRIEKENDILNAVVIKDYENARELAKQADIRISKGEDRLLEGIPGISKQVFCHKGLQSDACSKMLKGFISPYESTVTSRLKDAGVIMIGSANMDEFAMGSANQNSFYGKANSPWIRNTDGKRVIPGGSSGGSSAAVSAGFTPFAMGSDTGGSVRQPAALTGLVGIKPTYGRCSRYGMISFASSFDSAGVLTNNVEDSALLMHTMAGHDIQDSTCLNIEVEDYLKRINNGVKGLKIGIPVECMNLEGMNSDIKNSWMNVAKKLTESGAIMQDISLKNLKHGIAVYYALASAEAASNLSKYDGIRYGYRIEDPKNLEDLYVRNRAEGFGDEVKRRIFLGTYVLSSDFECNYYKKAKQVRNIIYQDFQDAFKNVDAILMPTTPDVARACDEKVSVMQNYISDILTVPVSVAGMTAISVPTGMSSSGLPIGMQLVANKFQEGLLFQIAKEIENSMHFHKLLKV
jgi:aspartyl-tRNA(Asn)/glutamyl-tRNA(Gln) amidotransferase subunit A